MQICKQEEEVIKQILSSVLTKSSSIDVFVFGSRAKNKAREFSDLDLALRAQTEVDDQLIFKLKAQFSESNLPYMVDIVDLKKISDSFYQAIKTDLVKFEY